MCIRDRLKAVGLPELITESDDEYVTLAVELACNPSKLRTIKDKLNRNRLVMPLFDTALFTRHFELAFSTMYTRLQAKLPPEHFHVSQ